MLYYNPLIAADYDGLDVPGFDALLANSVVYPPVTIVMDSPATILAAYLVSGSGALFTAPSQNQPWPIYISAMADGEGVPDIAAAVYDTSGVVTARYLRTGRLVQKFGIQLKTRAVQYADAYMQLVLAADLLKSVNRAVVAVGGNNYTVDTIMQTSTVLSAGQDQRRRAMAAVNFMMMLIGA